MYMQANITQTGEAVTFQSVHAQTTFFRSSHAALVATLCISGKASAILPLCSILPLYRQVHFTRYLTQVELQDI